MEVSHTRVALRDGDWIINDRPTNPGSPAEGLLMNARMVNAVFEDRNKPDTDAKASANRFIAKIPDYAAHGVNAFTTFPFHFDGAADDPVCYAALKATTSAKKHAEATPSRSSTEWTVGSSNGAIRATVMLDKSRGTASYRVSSRGVTVVERSPLGITTSVGDFTRDSQIEIPMLQYAGFAALLQAPK